MRESLEQCREERTWLAHEWGAQFAAFSPDGRRILSFCNNDLTACVWDAATGKRLATLKGYHMPIASAVFSPDGTKILLTYEHYQRYQYSSGKVRTYTDRAARLWDAATGKELAILQGHRSKMVSAAFSPDGKKIVTASWDKTARIWETATGKELAVLRGHDAVPLAAFFTPDGRQVWTASSCYDQRTDEYDRLDAEANALVDPPAGDPPPGVGPEERPVSSGYSQVLNTTHVEEAVLARLWDAATGQERLTLKMPPAGGILNFLDKPRQTLTAVALSPDGRTLFTALDIWGTRSENVVYLWDTQTGERKATFKDHGTAVHTAVYSPDGKRILVRLANQTPRVWDAATGKVVAVLKHDFTTGTFSPDGRWVLAVCGDGLPRAWDPATGDEVFVLRGHELGVGTARFDPQGRRIVTAGDSTIRVWEVASPREYGLVLRGHDGPVGCVAFRPDGRVLATGGKAPWDFQDKTVRLWDAATGKQLHVLRGLGSLGDSGARDKILGGVLAIQFSADGRRLLTGSADVQARLRQPDGKEEEVPFTPARLWEVATGKEVFGLKGMKSKLDAVVLSPDGRRVLTLETGRLDSRTFSPDGRNTFASGGGQTFNTAVVRLWDAETGKERKAIRALKDPVRVPSFSPNGKRFVTVNGYGFDPEGGVRLWDSADGTLMALRNQGSGVLHACFSPDGRRLFTAEGKTGRFWSAETGEELSALKGTVRSVIHGTFSPDGRRLLTASEHWQTVQLWDVEQGRPLHAFPHRLALTTAGFSADGQRVVTASLDGTAKVWDAASGKELFTLAGHRGVVHAAVFSPDGQRVATVSEDGTARLWPLDPLPLAVARKPRDLTPAERQRFEIPAEETPR